MEQYVEKAMIKTKEEEFGEINTQKEERNKWQIFTNVLV